MSEVKAIPYFPDFLSAPLTNSEFNLLTAFFSYCAVENIESFTIDDLRLFSEKRGFKLYGDESNQWGIILSKAKYQRLVKEVGRQPSTRLENHGRKVGVYRRI